MTTFEQLSIPMELKQTLLRNGFEKPTPVQAQAIPAGLEGRDLLVSSQTGSGKTIAYLIPLVAQMLENKNVRGLVVVPTRELALQVITVFRKITNNQQAIAGVSLVGGMPMSAQFRELAKNPKVIIATPGRLLDHCRRKPTLIRNFNFCVVDEADRMFDMGFLPQLKDILRFLSPQRQNLMFSATFPPSIKNLAREMLKNPVEVTIEKTVETAPKIDQKMVEVAASNKNDEVLNHLRDNEGTTLIFARTQKRADRLTKFLVEYGVKVGVIHGGRTQSQRNRSLSEFRSGAFRVLVATDVASRGIDVPHVANVVNYDLPMNPEDYVHRIGRTGRAGKSGQATSFVTPEDSNIWNQIARATGQPRPTHQRPAPRGQHQGGRRPPQGRSATGRPATGRPATAASSASGENRRPFGGPRHPSRQTEQRPRFR